MARTYNVGNEPPEVIWTVVRGDTASFKVYVTDDNKDPIDVSAWNINMDIKRAGSTVVSLAPEADADDGPGEFTVSLTAAESVQLESNDVFDIQLSLPQDQKVWTVAKGKVTIIEDITS